LQPPSKRHVPKVPVEYQDYSSEAEEYADLTADNRIAELADMNNTMLADLLAEIDTGEIPLELTGYTEEDFSSIIDSIIGVDDAEPNDQDDEHEQALPPMSKPGDLWILGPHRLICGDATDEATIDRLMDGEKAAMVHTDPPYGVSYQGAANSGNWQMIKNDDKTGDDLFNNLLLPAFNNYRKHTIPQAAFYIWHASSTRRDFEDAMMQAGLAERQYLIWAKNGISLGRADYQHAHEPCFYGCHANGNCDWFGDYSQPTVWEVKRDNTRNPLHPNQKPPALAQIALFNSSKPGNIVLDLFGGSGSTLIACEQTGRVCRMMEFDPKYCDVIRRRWAEVVAAFRRPARNLLGGHDILDPRGLFMPLNIAQRVSFALHDGVGLARDPVGEVIELRIADRIGERLLCAGGRWRGNFRFGDARRRFILRFGDGLDRFLFREIFPDRVFDPGGYWGILE